MTPTPFGALRRTSPRKRGREGAGMPRSATLMTDATATRLRACLAAARPGAEIFLAELVKTPSDNPPGDCAPHAARAAALLEAMGFTVERHVVPEAEVRAVGMVSCTNLVVRHGKAAP